MIPFSPDLPDRLRKIAHTALGDKGQRQTGDGQSPGNREFNAALRLEHNDFWLNSSQGIGDFADTGISRVRKPLLTSGPHCKLKGAMVDVEPCKYSCIHVRCSF